MSKTNTTAAQAPKTIESVDLSQCATKSAKIRALHAAGFATGPISKFLGIRYQHARNVLVTPVKTPQVAVQAPAAEAKAY
jgi:hypothetical protein